MYCVSLLYKAETNKNGLAPSAIVEASSAVGINISDIDGSNMTTVLTLWKNYTNNVFLLYN